MRYDPKDRPSEDKAPKIKGAHKAGPGGGKHADNPARGETSKNARLGRKLLKKQGQDAKDDKKKGKR